MLSYAADIFGREITHFVSWIAMLLLVWIEITLMIP